MTDPVIFDDQYAMTAEDYVRGLDLENWYRYYFLIKEIAAFRPQRVLEIGAGNEVVKNCLRRIVPRYEVMDICPQLKPDILSDLREARPELESRFDAVLCADVLEHMPFADLGKNLANIRSYLSRGGRAFITIPHRRIDFVFMTALSPFRPFHFALPSWVCLTPRSFISRFVKKEAQKDPCHHWEIGDGRIRRAHVKAAIREAGLEIRGFKSLFYVDFWILKKP
jgi:hypothetical protein